MWTASRISICNIIINRCYSITNSDNDNTVVMDSDSLYTLSLIFLQALAFILYSCCYTLYSFTGTRLQSMQYVRSRTFLPCLTIVQNLQTLPRCWIVWDEGICAQRNAGSWRFWYVPSDALFLALLSAKSLGHILCLFASLEERYLEIYRLHSSLGFPTFISSTNAQCMWLI